MTKSITLFCSLKPFHSHNALIQRNALNNWKHTPGITAVLFGNDAGVAEAAAEFGFDHIPNVALSEYGTPLLDDIFNKVQEHAKTPLVCYINGDILLPYDFAAIAKAVADQLPRFLMVGSRWDVTITESLDFSQGFSLLEEIRQTQGILHLPNGSDYFLFPKGMIDYMLPFCIGRPRWDNWLIGKTLYLKIPVLDASKRVTILHQNHDYKHVPFGTGDSWSGTPESARNINLMQDDLLKESKIYFLTDASHYLLKGNTVKVHSRRLILLLLGYKKKIKASLPYKAIRNILRSCKLLPKRD